MGIDDRDYMKRPCDDDERGSSPESRLEVFFGDFLREHPRLLLAILAILERFQKFCSRKKCQFICKYAKNNVFNGHRST